MTGVSTVLWARLSDESGPRRLRHRMMAAAQAQGIFTDEHVFNRVS
jgi:hypothetical protein